MSEKTIHDFCRHARMDDICRYEEFPEDDDDDDDDSPEARADPSCIVCGGQGGWCGDFSPTGMCIWVECDCVD